MFGYLLLLLSLMGHLNGLSMCSEMPKCCLRERHGKHNTLLSDIHKGLPATWEILLPSNQEICSCTSVDFLQLSPPPPPHHLCLVFYILLLQLSDEDSIPESLRFDKVGWQGRMRDINYSTLDTRWEGGGEREGIGYGLWPDQMTDQTCSTMPAL